MPPLYSHLYRVVQDLQGNVVSDVMGTIRVANTSDLAVLYADAEGLSTLPNPLVNNAEYGSFSVYLDSGHYDMSFAKTSYVFEELVDLYVHEATGGVVSITGTPNQVLVSAGFGDIVLSTPQNTDPDASVQFAHLGLGTPANAGLGLLVETLAQFNGSITARTVSAWGVTGYTFVVNDRAGNDIVGFHGGLQAAGGTNRWFLYGGGTAPSYLGGSLQVNGNTQLTTLTATSNVGISGSLTVTGTATINSSHYVAGPAGFGTAPVSGYSIVTAYSTSLAANVTVNLGTIPATYTLDVNGSVRSRSSFLCDVGATVSGGLYANSWVQTPQVNVLNFLGAGGFADNRFSLRSYATTYCDGFVGINVVPSYWLHVNGNAYFMAALGVQTGPDPSWPIACGGGILSYQTIQAQVQVKSASLYSWGTLQVDGAATINGALTTYGHCHLNSSFYFVGNGSIAGTLGVTGKTTVGSLQASYIGIGVEPNYEGYPFHVNAEAKFRSNIRVDGTGYKPGGGAWADSSLRALKRHIAPIEGALALLLAQQGRMYEWDEPQHAQALPGVRYGLVREEVTIRQWHVGDDGLAPQGFEALVIEALRTIVERLEALEGE